MYLMELDYVKLKQIKPAISGYVAKSQAILKKSPIPDEKGVHDIRVQMKKLRAVLKLVAPQMENSYYIKDISDSREVGRMLSLWRETAVYRKLLKDFRKEFPDIFSRLSENTCLISLMTKPESVVESSVKLEETLETIGTLLHKTGYRIRFQTMNILDPQLLIKELESTYIIVAGIYLKCRNNPKPELLHKFRKKAKDFLYQLYIFRPLNPPVIKELEKKLEIMTQNLGKFNDIFQIIKVLGYNRKSGNNTPALDELIIKFRDSQDRYLSKVWPSAYQIFCPGQKLVNILGFRLLVI